MGIRWSTWSRNCTTVSIAKYPRLIPDGTTVPAWAYLNITESDIFNPADAIALLSSPESTPAVLTPSATSTNTTTTETASIISSASSDATSTGDPPDPLPAVIGSVVGCVVAIGVLGLIAFFVLKRKHNRSNQNIVYAGAQSPSPTLLPQSASYVPCSPPPRFHEEDNNPISRGSLSITGSIPIQYVLSLNLVAMTNTLKGPEFEPTVLQPTPSQ
jgi:hypothetical protein